MRILVTKEHVLKWGGRASYEIWFFVRPDGIGSILHEERDRFLEIKERLRHLLENQITNFRLVRWNKVELQLMSQIQNNMTLDCFIELINDKQRCLIEWPDKCFCRQNKRI